MIPQINKSIWGLFFLVFGRVTLLVAQPAIDLNAYQTKYKDDDIVFLKDEEECTIDLSGNEVKIKNRSYSEMLFLQGKSSKYGQRDISYVNYFSEIIDLKAYTLLPNGKGGYKKLKVSEFEERKNTSEGVFYDDVNVKSFNFQQPEPGAIGVTDYTEKMKDPHFLGKFYFALGAPIEHSSFTVKVHKDIDLKYVLKNPGTDIVFTETREGNYNIYKWTRENAPKVKGEGQAKAVSYEIPHVIIRIASYKSKTGKIKVLETTKDLYDYCYSLLNKGFEPASDEIKRVTDSLTNNITDPVAKVKNIYYYIQNHMKYIAIEDGLGGFIPRSPSLVFSRKYGDCKDLATLLCSMMQYAGLEAYPTWIGTNDIPYRFDQEPVMGVANHMIAALWLNNRWYFIDGTADFMSWEYPSDFVQGKQAMIGISADSFQLAMVPVVSIETNCTIDSIFCKISGDTIMGSAVKSMDGLPRCTLSSSLNSVQDARMDEVLERILELGQNNCRITNIKSSGMHGRDSVLRFAYNYKIPKYVNKNGSRLYVNLNLERTWDNSEIELENRTREFIFDQVVSYKRYIEFEIPSGYSLPKLPSDYTVDSEKYGFKFTYTQSGSKIIYTQNYWFNVLEIKKSEFEEWNKLIEKLYKAYSQTVVLTTN